LRDKSKEGLHRSRSSTYSRSFLGERTRQREERQRERELSLAEQGWAVLEALRKDCPGWLGGNMSVRVCPCEGKQILKRRI
jgi:hypothetical protein